MKRLIRLLPVLAVFFCLAAVWGTGLRDSQYAWSDLALDRSVYGMTFEGNKLSFSTQAGDAHGVLSAGPHLDLPAGVYTIRWLVETDAENAFAITSSNGTRIEPARVAIPADSWTTETTVTLHEDAQDLQIAFCFDNGTRFAVHALQLISPAYTDRAWLLTFAAIGFLMLYGAWLSGKLTPQRVMTLCVLGAAVLFASMPALKADLSLGYDSVFHLARLRNLVSAWEAGQFPARVGGFTYNGYGVATSAMYPDLFFNLPALMLMTGASIQLAMHTLIVGTNLVTAMTMYALAKRLFGSRAAVSAAALYVLAAYRLTDLYPRAAYGEALGMAFVPLFLLGLYEVLAGDQRRWPLLALGATCVFQSHMLTTAICALAAVCFGVLSLGRVLREKRLGAVIKAIGMTVLLNLFFLLPFLSLGQMGLSGTVPPGRCADAAIAPAQLLAGMFTAGGAPGWQYERYHLKDFPVEIGLPLLAGALLALSACLQGQKRERRWVLALLGLSAGSALMCTTVFPWGILSRVSGGLSDVMQFPWRLLMVTDVCLALAAGYGFAALEKPGQHVGQIAALALSVICALPMLSDETLSLDYLAYGETVPSRIGYTDYSIPGTDTDLVNDVSIVTQGDVQLGEMVKEGTTLRVDVRAQTDATLTLPLFAYDGYRAQVDGAEMTLGMGENNRLTVSLSAGSYGCLTVWYAGDPLWRAADAVSLAALFSFAVFGIICQMNMKKVHDKN